MIGMQFAVFGVHPPNWTVIVPSFAFFAFELLTEYTPSPFGSKNPSPL
jgi:hypothetical protein